MPRRLATPAGGMQSRRALSWSRPPNPPTRVKTGVVSDPVGGQRTRSVPCMSLWNEQWNGYAPGLSGAVKLASILFVKGLAVVLSVVAIVAIARVAFGG